MSLERALINCIRCYKLGNSIREDYKELPKPSYERELYGNDKIYHARNEAMKSLEFVIKNSESVTLVFRIARDCLKNCVSCNYSSPKIVDIIKKS